MQVGDDELPAVDAERQHLAQQAAGDQAALRENRDAAAERLGVAQDVRAEEHRAAAIAQSQDQRADIAPAERIEAGHRLVEDDEIRLVDERLGNAHPLQHALGKLAQRVAALPADAHFVEQRVRRDAGARRTRMPNSPP